MNIDRKTLEKILILQGVSLVPRPKKTKSVSAGFSLKDAYNGKIASLEEVQSWKDDDRAAVAGVNGLFIIDSDSEDSYKKFWDSSYPSVQNETFTVKTSRGYSNWFFDSAIDYSKFAGTINARPCLEMELFISHHLAAVPGDVHPSGSTYDLLGTFWIKKKDGMLEAAINRLESFGWKGKTKSKAEFTQAIRQGVPQGQRHSIALRYTTHLLGKVKLDYETAFFEITRWNQNNRPPLAVKELESIVKSALDFVSANKKEVFDPNARW